MLVGQRSVHVWPVRFLLRYAEMQKRGGLFSPGAADSPVNAEWFQPSDDEAIDSELSDYVVRV